MDIGDDCKINVKLFARRFHEPCWRASKVGTFVVFT